MKSKIIKISIAIIVGILLLGLPLVAGYIANILPNKKLDPDGSFWWISIHHIAQAFLFVPLFILAKRFNPNIKFYLNKGDVSKGISYVWKFTLIFVIYTIISFAIVLISGTFTPFQHNINANNVIGYLGFQLLLSGPSEELIFRSFGVAIIAFIFPKRLVKGKFSVANLYIAIIFALAHIGIYFSPFYLSFSWIQIIYAFVLGMIYGDCFEKTKSVFYPMILHSISNVIAVGATIVVTVINGL
jgi:membrane protease YdiL (CAAX protease family)